MLFLHGGTSTSSDNIFVERKCRDFWLKMFFHNDQNFNKDLLLVDLAHYSITDNNINIFKRNYEFSIIRNQICKLVGHQFKISQSSLTKSELIDQLYSNSIIYFIGGSENLLNTNLNELGLVPILGQLLNNQGVTLGGDSAGANMWSTYVFSNDRNGIYESLGLKRIKTFCHYNSSKYKNLMKLFNYEPSIPTIPLCDYEYVVLEDNKQ